MVQKDLLEVEKLLRDNIETIVQEFNIKLVYIFGSYAKGKNTKRSDLDIAILMNKEYNAMDKLSLIGELTSIFKREDIDLVILNSASPVLCHQIIKYGKLVYMKNEDVKVNFEVDVLRKYMDMEPFRRTQMEIVKAWIKDNIGSENND